MSPKIAHILDTTPWSTLRDTYGTAENVPQLVAELLSPDLAIRQDAVNDLLYSRAYHQFDIYPVTPAIVEIAILLLEDPASVNLSTHGPWRLEDELVHFCRICAEGETSDQAIRDRISSLLRENREIFAKTTGSSLPIAARDAAWLMAFCDE